jgi:hypothetical protein
LSDLSEPAGAEIRPEIRAGCERIPFVAFVLAAFWLVIPALQYLGAVERTAMVLTPGYIAGPLGSMDLSPFYVALVGATALYAGIGLLARRSQGEEPAGS